MDTSSPLIQPQVTFKKHKGLHDNDSRFVEEVIKVVSSLDGAAKMKLKIHGKFPSRYTIILCDPPRMSLDDMNQIFLMNSKIINIFVDLKESQLKIESFKHTEDIKKKRKRGVAFDVMDLPDDYDLSMIDKQDKKHINGILKSVLGMTTMEFTTNIKSNASYYDLHVSDVEPLNVEYISEVVQKYRAFITNTTFNYPQNKLELKIRRNDTPITVIRQVSRKRLKILH